MEIQRECFFRSANTPGSEDDFMAILPDGMADEMKKLQHVTDEEVLAGVYEEQGRALLERRLCPAPCALSYVTMTRLALAMYSGSVITVERLKEEALDGCDIKAICFSGVKIGY